MTDVLTRVCPRRYPVGAPIAALELDRAHIFRGEPAAVEAAFARHMATCKADAAHEPPPAITDTELGAFIEDVARTCGMYEAIDDAAAAITASRNGDRP